MTESDAYQWAAQCLRDTEKMGIEPHHAQQLADRIASALVEATRGISHIEREQVRCRMQRKLEVGL